MATRDDMKILLVLLGAVMLLVFLGGVIGFGFHAGWRML